MKVSCLRHGLTALNARGVFSGIGEEGLTEDQVRDFSAIDFDATGFDAVYCSPAPRLVLVRTFTMRSRSDRHVGNDRGRQFRGAVEGEGGEPTEPRTSPTPDASNPRQTPINGPS